jgi:hypothetical protein
MVIDNGYKLLKQSLIRKCKRDLIDMMKWDLIPVYTPQLKFEISTFGPTVPKMSMRGDEMLGDGDRVHLGN